MAEIRVFDNPIPTARCETMYRFLRNTKYRIGWSDSPVIERTAYQYLHSPFDDSDLERFGIIKDLEGSELMKFLQDTTGVTKPVKSVVNLSVPSDVHFTHIHPGEIVVLYYANLDWHEEWAGETLFFDVHRKNVEFASAYIPGRIIVFDGDIPHTIRPQSIVAPHYRFSVSMFFPKRIV